MRTRSYMQGQQQAGAALCEGYMGPPRGDDYREQAEDFDGNVDWDDWYRGYCDWMSYETGLDPRM